MGRLAVERSVHVQSSGGSSALRRSAGSQEVASKMVLMVRLTIARVPERSCRLGLTVGMKRAEVAWTW